MRKTFKNKDLTPEKFLQKKLGAGYVYIEESFDTIFGVGYGVRTTLPALMGYGSGKSPMTEKVNFCVKNNTDL